MFNLLHNFTPQPVLFEIGFFSIRYYGLFISLALFISVFLGLKLAKKNNFNQEEIFDLAFWIVLLGIVGARLYFVFILEPIYFFSNPLNIIKIWQGGLAIHGAIIAGVLTLIYWCWKNKKDFWGLADIIAVILPLAQVIGRFGNYFNQELFGRPTDLPWGIPIEIINRPIEFIDQKYFHPTFLYEAILNLFLFLILFFLYKNKKLKKSQYLGVYLIGYGLIRFMMEFIRIDQTAMIFGFRWPQVFSLTIVFVAVFLVFLSNKKKYYEQV